MGAEHRFAAHQVEQRVQLAVLVWGKVAQRLDELGELLQIERRLFQQLIELVEIGIQDLDVLVVDQGIGVVGGETFVVSRRQPGLDGRQSRPDLVDDPSVARLPTAQARLNLAVSGLCAPEGEQLAEQAVARELEGGGRTLQTLNQTDADQLHDLFAPATLEIVQAGGVPQPFVDVVHRQLEQRPALVESFDDEVEQPLLHSGEVVVRHLGRLAKGEDRRPLGLRELAGLDVGAAALDNQAID